MADTPGQDDIQQGKDLASSSTESHVGFTWVPPGIVVLLSGESPPSLR